MKRVKAACITQTLHFLLKEDAGHDYAIKLVEEEVRRYKDGLDKTGTKYKILSENKQEDGSCLCFLQPLCCKWTYPDGGDRSRQYNP